MNDLFCCGLIKHFAVFGVLSLGFIEFLRVNGFTKLFQCSFELRLGRTIACSALEGLAMALFSTLNIWHFTTPECDLNTIIPRTGAAYDAKNPRICLGLSGNSSLTPRVTRNRNSFLGSAWGCIVNRADKRGRRYPPIWKQYHLSPVPFEVRT